MLSATVGKSGIYMEGRELQIDRAVDKGTANQFTTATKKETEERDKRNLYLATEGCTSCSVRVVCVACVSPLTRTTRENRYFARDGRADGAQQDGDRTER